MTEPEWRDLRDDSGPIPNVEMFLEVELIQSVVDYLAEGREPLSESTYSKLKAAWTPPLEPPLRHAWDWESLDDCHVSPMWRHFYHISGSATCHQPDPFTSLQHVPFLPYRRLGFAIW